MAKYYNGILGAVSGRIGELSAFIKNGKNILIKPTKRLGLENTELQKENMMKFGLVVHATKLFCYMPFSEIWLDLPSKMWKWNYIFRLLYHDFTPITLKDNPQFEFLNGLLDVSRLNCYWDTAPLHNPVLRFPDHKTDIFDPDVFEYIGFMYNRTKNKFNMYTFYGDERNGEQEFYTWQMGDKYDIVSCYLFFFRRLSPQMNSIVYSINGSWY